MHRFFDFFELEKTFASFSHYSSVIQILNSSSHIVKNRSLDLNRTWIKPLISGLKAQVSHPAASAELYFFNASMGRRRVLLKELSSTGLDNASLWQ